MKIDADLCLKYYRALRCVLIDIVELRCTDCTNK